MGAFYQREASETERGRKEKFCPKIKRRARVVINPLIFQRVSGRFPALQTIKPAVFCEDSVDSYFFLSVECFSFEDQPEVPSS